MSQTLEQEAGPMTIERPRPSADELAEMRLRLEAMEATVRAVQKTVARVCPDSVVRVGVVGVPPVPKIAEIIDAVTQETSTEWGEMRAMRRDNKYRVARRILIYSIRVLRGCSFPEIGAIFTGQKNHSMTMEAFRRVRAQDDGPIINRVFARLGFPEPFPLSSLGTPAPTPRPEPTHG